MDFFRRTQNNTSDTRDTSGKTSEKTSFDRSQLGSMPEDGPEASNVPTHKEAESPSSIAVSDEPTWPSGWRPYASLFGGFLLMFNSWGIVNAYGTYASYYDQHLLPGRDILLLNLVGSTQSFVVLALSAFVGRFLDAGHSRQLIGTGTVLVSLGTFLLSVVNGQGRYNQGNYGLIWLTQGFISGLGMACFFVSSSQGEFTRRGRCVLSMLTREAVVSTWFKKKKGFAIGVVASGASIAGLVYPMMTKFLITEVGFNDAVRYVGVVVAVTSVIAVLVARPNPAHPLRKPETWLRVSVYVDTHAFQNASFVWLCAAISILFFGFYAVFFNLEEWAASTGLGYRDEVPGGVDIGLPQEVPEDAIRTFYLLSIMNGASTIGRLGSSYLCDHFGALNVHATVTLIASLLILLLWTMVETVAGAIAFVVCFGVFSGAVIGLPPASVAYILGPVPAAQAKLGQWTGMLYSTSAVFALTGPVIAGYLITEHGNFLTVQCWSGACLLLSACCMAIAIFYRRRSSAREWMADWRNKSTSSASRMC